MERINDYKQAINLIQNYTLISKPYGSSAIMYSLVQDKILVVNHNLRTFITFEEFKEHFENSIFYYIKQNSEENEINQEHINYRQ